MNSEFIGLAEQTVAAAVAFEMVRTKIIGEQPVTPIAQRYITLFSTGLSGKSVRKGCMARSEFDISSSTTASFRFTLKTVLIGSE
jgi:hypothetical protein